MILSWRSFSAPSASNPFKYDCHEYHPIINFPLAILPNTRLANARTCFRATTKSNHDRIAALIFLFFIRAAVFFNKCFIRFASLTNSIQVSNAADTVLFFILAAILVIIRSIRSFSATSESNPFKYDCHEYHPIINFPLTILPNTRLANTRTCFRATTKLNHDRIAELILLFFIRAPARAIILSLR